GRPARVRAVDVVGRTCPEVARTALGTQSAFVISSSVGRLGVASILNDEDVGKKRKRRLYLRDSLCELTMHDDRLQIGIVEQIAQLVFDVPIVDVDRD